MTQTRALLRMCKPTLSKADAKRLVRVEAGVRRHDTLKSAFTADSRYWHPDEELDDVIPLDDVRVEDGAILDLYLYADDDLLGNADALVRDGKIVAVCDPHGACEADCTVHAK